EDRISGRRQQSVGLFIGAQGEAIMNATVDNSATQMLVSASMEFLRRYAPFDRMEAEALRFMVERIKLAYYPKDTQIVSPEKGVVETFYILQRGKVL
ncbi:hypothetical protein JZU56_04150, partial [bacterium]|nr:hypothetical protein [bacterium]